MCFDRDASPPIASIVGGALGSSDLVLTADDGHRLRAFSARTAEPTGSGIVILPDVRGLHPYYEELALRFAERGIDAVAIDYFGRTAGTEPRDADFDVASHMAEIDYASVVADIRAGAAHLRTPEGGGVASAFTIGFCFGGRLAFLTAGLGLGLAGVIGFYGIPVGPGRKDVPEPAALAGAFDAAVLGIFGGADPSIPAASVTAFETALTRAGVDHQIVTYAGAPHSFFDRQAAEFAAASAAAWDTTLGFIRDHAGA
jgi:carboxymethylenebutenolidase